jgi:transposase
MAKGYRPVLRDQLFLLPPDMREWLPAGHPVHLVIGAVGRMDTSAFHARRRTGGAGAAGFDPDMVVTVLVWAYANGVTSSRRIEDLCRTDAAFRLAAGGNTPDHCVIADFRKDAGPAMAALFEQVLVLCAELGMGKLGVVALDGTKIAANASKSANRGEARLRELAAELAAAHERTDAAEDALFGQDRRGDEPPGGGGWRDKDKAARIDAAIAAIEAARAGQVSAREDKARAHIEQARQNGPRAGHVMPEAGPQIAQIALYKAIADQEAKIADWHARNAGRAAAGKPLLTGTPPLPPERSARVRRARDRAEAAQARKEKAAARAAANDQARNNGSGPAANLTDPGSRLMPTRNGFIQGYNPQQVTSADKLIIATELTDTTTDSQWFEPMLERAQAAARLITAHQPTPPSGQGNDPGPASPGQPATSGAAGYLPPASDGSPGRYDGPIGLFLSDAGYCSESSIGAPGPPRLIATGKRRDLEQAARDGSDGKNRDNPHTTAMAALLATTTSLAAYRQRGHIAETPHGDIKHNLGIRRLSMRGKTKAAAEWNLITATYNLRKAITTGHLTPATLTT